MKHATTSSTKKILDEIRSLNRALRLLETAVQKRFKVTNARLFVLHKIAEHPRVSLNELADYTATDQSSVSVVVQRLVDDGFVLRDRSSLDGRRLELSLTAKGRGLVRRAPHTPQEKLLDALASFKESERAQLSKLLARLVNAVGMDERPPMLFEDGIDGNRAKKSR